MTLEKVSNGVKGFNAVTINVCYIGGIDHKCKAIDNRTTAQKQSLVQVLKKLKQKYPKAIIQGHIDFENVKKDCPCFNAKVEYYEI